MISTGKLKKIGNNLHQFHCAHHESPIKSLRTDPDVCRCAHNPLNNHVEHRIPPTGRSLQTPGIHIQTAQFDSGLKWA
jgi:hypothetical protein